MPLLQPRAPDVTIPSHESAGYVMFARVGSARLVRLLAAVAVAATLAACVPPGTPPPTDLPGTPVGDDLIGLNEIQMLGSHNSYHLAPDSGALAALILAAAANPDIAAALGNPAELNYEHADLVTQLNRGIRTFELDVYADPVGGLFSSPLLAQLLGLPQPGASLAAPGLKVLHIVDIDYRSSCPTLQACLALMRTWSDAHPGHMPIVVNLELKDDLLPAPFDTTPVVPFDAAQLDVVDAELTAAVGDRLITPDDVRGVAPDLRTAVTTNGWPTVEDSRGRFLFFMDNANLRTEYLVGHPSLQGRVMFTSSGEGQPDGAILKVNDPGDGTRIAQLVADGYMVRTRADGLSEPPTAARREVALSSGAQIVHSDYPPGETYLPTGYTVNFGTRTAARCNPVLTTAATCAPPAVIEPI